MIAAPLSEMPERVASGRIAAIYQDLRDALGISNVNLVFRHMATVPGCLPWAWDCLAPLYRARAIHDAAGALTAEAALVCNIARRPVLGPAVADVAATLDAYIRANPINMLGLQVLARALEVAPGRGIAMPQAPLSPPPPPRPILPMPDLASLSPDAMARLRRLAVMVHGAEGPVIPSIFRHFVPWPDALAAIEEVVTELMRADRLQEHSRAMVARGADVARALPVAVAQAPSPAVAATIRDLANMFPANMAKMTLIALALQGVWCGES